MAEEEGKVIQWPGGADEATDFDFLMVGKNNKPIMKIPKEKLNEVIVINGEGVKAVAGGASSSAPTILRPGPAGQNRKMEDVQGWFVNGTSAEPPVATGTAWEAPAGKKNTNWWDGTAKVWSLGSSVPLPATKETSSLVSNPSNRINFNTVSNKLEIKVAVPIRCAGVTYTVDVQEVPFLSGAISASIVLDKQTLSIKIIANGVALKDTEALVGMYIIENGILYVSGIDNYTINGVDLRNVDGSGRLSVTGGTSSRINFNTVDRKIEVKEATPVRADGKTYTLGIQEIAFLTGATAASVILDKDTLTIKVISNTVDLKNNESLLGMYNIESGVIYVSGIDNYTINGTADAKFDDSYGQLITTFDSVVFNTTDNTVKFEGSNILATLKKRYILPTQTISYKPNPAIGRCALFVDKSTGLIKAIEPSQIGTSTANSVQQGFILLGTVYTDSTGKLIVTGITNYKVIPEASAVIPQPNKFFDSGSYASGIDWLQRAIVSVEWYNVPNNGNRRFYVVGKNYPSSGKFRTYLAFRENDTNNFIIPTDWTGSYVETDAASTDFTGIKTYYLRRAADPNVESSYIGRIAINWSEVPEGQRAFEGYVAGGNSKFNQFTFTTKSGQTPSEKTEYLVYETAGLNQYYNSNVTDDYSNDSAPSFPKNLGTIEKWYDAWDALMLLAPAGFITKHTLGTEVPSLNGNKPIYAYEFHPDIFDTRGSTREPYSPKCIATLSIHGGEKTCGVAFYLLIREMLTNWQNNEYLEFLRFNIPFVIIPSCNPAGWNSGSRYNNNGVDLNRNFPIGWSASDTSGSAAASEIETQYIMTYLSQFKDNIFLGIDHHNFGMVPTNDGRGYYMTYNTAFNDLPLIMNIGKTFNAQASRKYKAKDSRIPQDFDIQLGYSRTAGAQGLLRDYLFSLGAYSSTFETMGQFPYDLAEKLFSPLSLNFAIESQANFWRMMIKNCMYDFNSK